MSDSWYSGPTPGKQGGSDKQGSRQLRRGAGLALVFASVLATGAATGAWGDDVRALGDSSGDLTARGAANAQLGDGTHESDEDDAHRADSLSEETSRGPGGDAEDLVSRSGDRWSAAYTAREFEGLQRTLDGEYVGVGLSVRRLHDTDGEPYTAVARVAPDSPADRAGVRTGDRLRAVDGEDVSDKPVTDVVARLRGTGTGGRSAESSPLGTYVDVELERGGLNWRETLRRSRLAADAVTVDDMGRGVSRIKISSFTKGSGKQVREALEEEASRSSGILLDLRGNSGGLVEEAVSAASVFLDGGLVATYEEHGDQHALYADHDGRGHATVPLVVLVDGGTMSAAELLTGALQDRGRAVVVGSRTFGKGSVQMPRRLPDGSVAELTVGHYTTPSGRRLDGEGIGPDLPVSGDADAAERARTVLSGLEPPS